MIWLSTVILRAGMIWRASVVWRATMAWLIWWAGVFGQIGIVIAVCVVVHIITRLARTASWAGVIRPAVAPHVSNAEDRGATVLLEQLAHTHPRLKGLHQFFHRHPT